MRVYCGNTDVKPSSIIANIIYDDYYCSTAYRGENPKKLRRSQKIDNHTHKHSSLSGLGLGCGFGEGVVVGGSYRRFLNVCMDIVKHLSTLASSLFYQNCGGLNSDCLSIIETCAESCSAVDLK
jgi:hypothetical protein